MAGAPDAGSTTTQTLTLPELQERLEDVEKTVLEGSAPRRFYRCIFIEVVVFVGIFIELLVFLGIFTELVVFLYTSIGARTARAFQLVLKLGVSRSPKSTSFKHEKRRLAFI